MNIDEKFLEELENYKYKCKHCGHKSIISNRTDKVVCSWCGNYVFKNERDEFRYRIREKIKCGD